MVSVAVLALCLCCFVAPPFDGVFDCGFSDSFVIYVAVSGLCFALCVRLPAPLGSHALPFVVSLLVCGFCSCLRLCLCVVCFASPL